MTINAEVILPSLEQSARFLEISEWVFQVVRVPKYPLDSIINRTPTICLFQPYDIIQVVIEFINLANQNSVTRSKICTFPIYVEVSLSIYHRC